MDEMSVNNQNQEVLTPSGNVINVSAYGVSRPIGTSCW